MAQECGSIDLSPVLQRLSAIEQRIAALDGRVAAQGGQLSAIQQGISTLRELILQLGATVREGFNQLGQTFREGLEQLGATLRTSIEQLGATLRELLAQVGQTIRENFANLLNFLRALFGVGSNQQLDQIRSELQGIKNAIDGLRNLIQGVGRQIDRIYAYVDRLAGLVQEALRYVRGIVDLSGKLDAIAGGIAQIKATLGRILEAIRGIKAPDFSSLNGRLAKIEGLLNRILNAIGGIRFQNVNLNEVLKLLNNILGLLQGLKTQIVQAIKEIIIAAIKELFQSLFRGRGKDDEILAKLRDIDRALQSVQNVLLGMRGKIDQILEAVRGLGSANLDRIYNYLDRIAGLVQQVLSYVKGIPDIYQAVTRPGSNIADLINQVLAEIRKIPPQLTKVGNAIGVNDLPANLPTSLISKRGTKDSTQSVPSIAQFMAWQATQFDALMGQWEIEIEIQDTDLTRAGNQTKKIALPNLAEAVAEQVGLLVNLNTSVDALLNIGVRTLSEAGFAHKESALAHIYGRENAQFLGYEGKEINIKIPMAFNPGATTLENTLKNSDVNVRGWENIDKQDLRYYLHEFLTAASIIRTVYWQKLDPKKDLKKQIIDLVKGAARVGEGGDTADDKWDEYLDRVEQGFTSEPGISDTVNPYGRSSLRRPRIRKLGGNKGGGGGINANINP